MTIAPPKDHAEKVERLRAVLGICETHPENWSQHIDHWKTVHCYAAMAQLVALGLPPNTHADSVYELGRDTWQDGSGYLGLPVMHPLFDSHNTLADLRRIVEEIAASPARQGEG